MIACLGIGFSTPETGGFDLLSMDRIRYGKIILVSDTSSEAWDQVRLALVFLYQHMRPLIAEGFVYVANAQLNPDMSEVDFQSAILDSSTRSLVQIVLGPDLDSTLASLDQIFTDA